jgi:hypothetical protein
MREPIGCAELYPMLRLGGCRMSSNRSTTGVGISAKLTLFLILFALKRLGGRGITRLVARYLENMLGAERGCRQSDGLTLVRVQVDMEAKD